MTNLYLCQGGGVNVFNMSLETHTIAIWLENIALIRRIMLIFIIQYSYSESFRKIGIDIDLKSLSDEIDISNSVYVCKKSVSQI